MAPMLLLVAGTAAVQPLPATAATPAVVLDSLTLPASVQPGQSVTASARVHSTSGTIAVQAITVAVRSSGGTAYDFPGATAASVPTGGYTFTSGARTFTAGTYSAFVAVLVNGQWTNLTPAKTLTVAAAPATVVLDSLTLPATAQPNQSVTATAKVRSTGASIAVQAVAVAIRSSSGGEFDFPGATAATIPSGGYTYTPGARSFPAGTYTAFVAIYAGGTWTQLTPSKTLTVAATTNPVTFSQDFTGAAGASANTGLSGTTWWNDPCWQNNPACTGSLAQYKDDHARLDGQGALVLTADRSPDAGAMCLPVRCTYASGRITMRNWADPSGTGPASFSQTGGHFEARIKAPTGQGLWPGFWTAGTGDWPNTGEIDILEAFGGQGVGNYAHAGSSPANDIAYGDTYPLPSGVITDWHTYAIDWDASANGYIKWSVDGVLTQTLTAARAGAAWTALQKPQAIIFDLAVGGDAVDPPNASTVFPARMSVDYVRVYQNPMR